MLKNLIISAAIFGMAFFVQIDALQNGFVWDDQSFVVDNNSIRKISNLPSFFYEGRTVSSKSSWGTIYRPLRTAIYALEYQLWGLSPKGYHLTNLLLHGVNSAAIFFLGLALSLGRGPSALGALIAALHPVNSEAVAWISARADLMMTFFFLLASLFYLKEFNSARSSRLSAFWTGAFLALALLSKETAAVFPGLALMFHLAMGGKLKGQSFRKYLRINIPLWAIVLVYIILSRYVTGQISEYEFIGGSWWATAAVMLRGFAYYIALIFFPTSLNADYSQMARVSFGFGLGGLISAFILAGAIAGAAALWRISRFGFFLMLCFVASLSPVSNIIVPLNFPIAERWLYQPMVWLSLLFGIGLWELGFGQGSRGLRFKKIAWACLAGILIFNLGFLSARRVKVWRNEATLWADVGKRWPLNPNVHNSIGNSYIEKGDVEKAALYYRQAAKIDPDFAEPRYNMGNLYQISGQYDRALVEYNSALLLGPHHTKALINLGQALWKLGYLDRVILINGIAIEADPRSSIARNNQGVAMARAGYIDGAANNYRKAVAIDPGFAEAMSNLGDLYSARGLISEAEQLLLRAVKIKPGLAEAHNNLGAVYGRGGNYDKSIAEFKLVVLKSPGYALGRRNLGAALKFRGLFDMALKEFELAVRLEPEAAEARLDLADIFLNYLRAKDKALIEISNAININRRAQSWEVARELVKKIGPGVRIKKMIDAP